jgi:hypothetical protein
MKRRVYCLAVMESLSPVGSLESFCAVLTKNLSNDCCFWENRLNCEYVTLSRQTSSTRIAKHRSFIKLKYLQNFCSSCKTLAGCSQSKVLLYLYIHIMYIPPRWCLYLIVVRRFVCASDPESYTSGSVATGRASLAGQVKG